MQLQILVDTFDRVYFCRGNHEKRWIDMNLGMVGMEELFYMTGITEGYEITLDDHMRLKSGKENWLLAHPRNFRQTPLSVARDLASKYRMNVVSAHGHQWTQGADRSGHYLCLDGGGMFDASELEYLRCTSCYPAVQGGYYIIAGGVPVPVKNEGGVKIP